MEHASIVGGAMRPQGGGDLAGSLDGDSTHGSGSADSPFMWNYILRHRILLRAIYARSQPL
jgi:hypothetical protein